MAKSKAKRKKSNKTNQQAPAWGGMSGKDTGKTNMALGALVVLLLAGGAVYWFTSSAGKDEFVALAQQGQAGMSAVQNFPDLGQRHLAPGEIHVYQSSIPTSGPHDPTWVEPGFYDTVQEPTRLVHSLEHGSVVIYYDEPGDPVMSTLKDWTALYPGRWEGVVAAPLPGLGETIVLAAWTKSLTQQPFEPAVAAAFVEAYRGRGPENPMR